jgi:hypothetical protein
MSEAKKVLPIHGDERLKEIRERIAANKQSQDNDGMNAVSKDLLDARLETIEVRMDARMARIEDSLKAIASSQTEVLASNKSTRTTMIVTGISSVLAIVLGVGAFNATVLSNMVASFESGKNTAAMQATLTEATKALEVATAKAQAAAVTKPKQ